jgi:asparagine synthase (glutamine-hydrolysing)
VCGLLALIGTPWQASAQAALSRLSPRGPDAHDIWSEGSALLGHTRLSVIDIAGGAQPMQSEDARYVLVYNGELYNFKALRRELEALGHRFRTQSDSEVLLQGYIAWGRDLLPRLDGMFAFAVWDARERRLFAARDRFGIKPLFYSTHRGFSAASTLAPFFQLSGFPHTLDYVALRDYLAFQTPLAPATFLRDVRQLEPAHWLEWQETSGRLARAAFWDIPAARDKTLAREETLSALDELLRKSVSQQLVADVPLGAFLSGGIDSSLLVHYMAELGARPLLTFNVRFDETGFDESAAALAVSQRYGTEHHVVDAPHIGADALIEALDHLDQPLADPAYIPTYQLSAFTRRHVTVALSGDGADELFGGYERFRDTEQKHSDTPVKRALRAAIRSGIAPGALTRRSLAGQHSMLYRRVELGPWRHSRKDLARYLTPDALAACEPHATLDRWRELIRAHGPSMDTASLMRADLWTYLSENCLVKTDRASMAHGLEVRVPMLANAVAEFALAQPARAHVDPEPKALLRALARNQLPDAVWRRPKHGFSVPLASYFTGAWREVCEDVMMQSAQIAPFLRADAVHALWRGASTGRASRRLAYTIVVLLLWLKRHPLA